MVAIWEDPRPMFYVNFSRPSPTWRRNRLTKAEVERLHEGGCPIRLSFYSSTWAGWRVSRIPHASIHHLLRASSSESRPCAYAEMLRKNHDFLSPTSA